MKNKLLALLLGNFIFISCQNNKNEKTKMEETVTQADSSQHLPDSALKQTSPSFSNLDPKTDSSISMIVADYLKLKNALVDDDANAAANAGNQLSEQMGKFDKSSLTEDQKKFYESIADDLKENAEHISESKKDIEHQREHFTMMSDEVYQLVKAFGGGRPLFVNNCPMANDNKGGTWLSEFKEVKNPYYAGKMNKCVKIEEVIK